MVAVGDRVRVKGYSALGYARFVGPHYKNGKPKVGVELDTATGRTNGTVKKHSYFSCAKKHGVLVAPSKVTILFAASGDADAEVRPSSVVLPKYETMARVALLNLLRKRYVDYGHCGSVDELRALASSTDPNPPAAVGAAEDSTGQSGGLPVAHDEVDEPAVGKRCTVKGYAGEATIRWVGEHHLSGKSRIGVEFDKKVGKNNGTVKEHAYFSCEDGFGNLVPPSNVTMLQSTNTTTAAEAAVPDNATRWADNTTNSVEEEVYSVPTMSELVSDGGATISVDRYHSQLIAFYRTFAPGTKTDAQLLLIAQKCAEVGHGWLNAPLQQKYGTSYKSFIRGQFLSQLVSFYDKYAPDTKTRTELRPIAEKCAEIGHEWLDEPLQQKYGASFSAHITSGGGTSGAEPTYGNDAAAMAMDQALFSAGNPDANQQLYVNDEKLDATADGTEEVHNSMNSHATQLGVSSQPSYENEESATTPGEIPATHFSVDMALGNTPNRPGEACEPEPEPEPEVVPLAVPSNLPLDDATDVYLVNEKSCRSTVCPDTVIPDVADALQDDDRTMEEKAKAKEVEDLEALLHGGKAKKVADLEALLHGDTRGNSDNSEDAGAADVDIDQQQMLEEMWQMWEKLGPPDPSALNLGHRLHPAARYTLGYMPDEAFTCSRPVRNKDFGASSARLDSTTGCVMGIPPKDPENVWLQIDLGGLHTLGQVFTKATSVPGWAVTALRITTSIDGTHWTPVKSPSDPDASPTNGTTYKGNLEPNSVNVITLPPSTVGRFVRIHAVEWRAEPGIRVELYTRAIGLPIGLADRTLAADRCSSSTEKIPSTAAHYARLVMHGSKAGLNEAWQPAARDQSPYLKFDFNREHTVELLTAVAIQGRTTTKGQWVTQFTISTNWQHGSCFEYIMDPHTLAPKVFEGNVNDTDTALIIFDTPVVAGSVRIHPVSAKGGIAMRAEVFSSTLGKLVGSRGRDCLDDSSFTAGGTIKATATAKVAGRGRNTCEPSDGRLMSLGTFGGWVSPKGVLTSWFQLDLGSVSRIFGVMTQGRNPNEWSQAENWTTEYSLETSVDGTTFKPYRDDAAVGPTRFTANTDAQSVVTNLLEHSVAARFVRFRIHNWHKRDSGFSAAMRAAVISGSMGQPLNIEFGTALLSSTNTAGNAELARLETNEMPGGWIVDSPQITPNTCLTVDLEGVFDIEGIIMQGSADKTQPCWVKVYRLEYSCDGIRWRMYSQARSSSLLIGNNSGGTACTNLRTPCRARYLRIYPTFWETRIGLRIELLGGPGPDWIQPVFSSRLDEASEAQINEENGMVEDEDEEFGWGGVSAEANPFGASLKTTGYMSKTGELDILTAGMKVAARQQSVIDREESFDGFGAGGSSQWGGQTFQAAHVETKAFNNDPSAAVPIAKKPAVQEQFGFDVEDPTVVATTERLNGMEFEFKFEP